MFQGKPTEAMKESKVLQYGEVHAEEYVEGAEVLKDETELQELEDDQGRGEH